MHAMLKNKHWREGCDKGPEPVRACCRRAEGMMPKYHKALHAYLFALVATKNAG